MNPLNIHNNSERSTLTIHILQMKKMSHRTIWEGDPPPPRRPVIAPKSFPLLLGCAITKCNLAALKFTERYDGFFLNRIREHWENTALIRNREWVWEDVCVHTLSVQGLLSRSVIPWLALKRLFSQVLQYFSISFVPFALIKKFQPRFVIIMANPERTHNNPLFDTFPIICYQNGYDRKQQKKTIC